MTIQDAQKNLQNLIDVSIKKGNIFISSRDVITMQASLDILSAEANKIYRSDPPEANKTGGQEQKAGE